MEITLFMRSRLFSAWTPGIVMLAMCPLALAGAYSWTQAKVSAAINYAGADAITAYAPDAFKPGSQAHGVSASGGRITTVHASRDYHGQARVQTRVCWNGTDRCVPMAGQSLNTQAFKGLDAGKPIYLVHTVLGKGPLPAPLFVKGNVIVWYDR